MLIWLKNFFFGKNQALALLESENLYLRAQNTTLLEQLKNLTEKPKAREADFNSGRPRVLDKDTKKFRPKTDEEIAEDQAALKELGIL